MTLVYFEELRKYLLLCGPVARKVCLSNKISILIPYLYNAPLLQGKVPVCQQKTKDLLSLNNILLPAIPLSLFHVFLHIAMVAQFC